MLDLHLMEYFLFSGTSVEYVQEKWRSNWLLRNIDVIAKTKTLLMSGFSRLFSGECGMVQLLLAKGACVDPVAYCGTPLHVAATEGRDGAMKILLDHNADVSFTACRLCLKTHAFNRVLSAPTFVCQFLFVMFYFIDCIWVA